MAYYTAGIVGSYFRDAVTPNGFDISGSTVSASNFLMASGGRFRDTSGNIDISGGNLTVVGTITAGAISSSGIAPTNIVVPGYIRDNIVSPNMDISGGNIRIAGTFIGSTVNTSNTIGGVTLSNTRVLTGAGTVAAPAYTFVNDLSMGLYDPSTNVLGLVTSGVERMRIASDGAVGIGTTNPGSPLDISAAGDRTAIRVIASSTSPGDATTTMLHPNLTAGNQAYRIFGVSQSQSNVLQELFTYAGSGSSNNSWNIRFNGQSAGDGLMLLANGNLGLRTRAPAYLLDVSGTAQMCNALVPGYLRNNLGASQFDISGGNINLAGTITGSTADTNNSIGGVTLSNTNLILAGTIMGLNPGASNQIGGVTLSNNAISNTGTINTLNVRLSAQGSAFAPALTIGNDISRGFYTPSANSLAISIAGVKTANFSNNLIEFSNNGAQTLFLTNNQLLANLGSVSLPSYAFIADASMGLYRAGTNILGVSTAGVERMRVDATGRVGIGIAAPAFLLDVSGLGNVIRATNGSALFRVSLDVSDYANTYLNGYLGVLRPGTSDTSVPVVQLGAENGGHTYFGVGLTSNYVGIGTKTPAAALDVSSSSGLSAIIRSRDATSTTLRLQTNNIKTSQSNRIDFCGLDAGSSIEMARVSSVDMGFGVSPYLGNLTFFTRNGNDLLERMRIDQSGNVGIGTSNPLTRTHILGASNDVSYGVLTLDNAATFSVGNGLNFGTSLAFRNFYKNSGIGGSSIQGKIDVLKETGSDVADSYMAFSTKYDPTRSGLTQGVLTEGMRLSALGRLGIGTTAPAYQLDVCGGSTAASINMATWDRSAGSNCMTARGLSALRGNCLEWKTPSVSIDANLATFQAADTSGSYLIIRKSGIWSISYTYNANSAGQTPTIDVCGSLVSSAYQNALTSPGNYNVLALNGLAPGVWGGVSYHGYLPSNTNLFYKFRTDNPGAVNVNDRTATLNVIFHQEMANGRWANFPAL